MSNSSETTNVTDDEINQVAEILSRLPKGFLPFPIFIQVTRLVTTPTMEVAPLRMVNGSPEIYLTQRPHDDPYWPSGWHIPGTVIRSTDNEHDFSSGFARVLADELGEAFTFVEEPVFVGIKFWDVSRGRELDMVHYVHVEVDEDAILPGKFFTVDELPETTLEHHKIMIPEIIAAFESARN